MDRSLVPYIKNPVLHNIVQPSAPIAEAIQSVTASPTSLPIIDTSTSMNGIDKQIKFENQIVMAESNAMYDFAFWMSVFVLALCVIFGIMWIYKRRSRFIRAGAALLIVCDQPDPEIQQAVEQPVVEQPVVGQPVVDEPILVVEPAGLQNQRPVLRR